MVDEKKRRSGELVGYKRTVVWMSSIDPSMSWASVKCNRMNKSKAQDLIALISKEKEEFHSECYTTPISHKKTKEILI